MRQYEVRSGQNIYDVAITLYGCVEGIFDLLVSNPWLTMETTLRYGMILNYHEEFIINRDIAIWLKDKDIIVKNGEHTYNVLNISDLIESHFMSEHQDICESLEELSPDERSVFWEGLTTPRLLIQQQGQLCTVRFRLSEGKHLVVDWGDYSAPDIIEGSEDKEIEHCYKSLGQHVIQMYGDFEFDYLDLKETNGIAYPLDTIYADSLVPSTDIDDLTKLIVKR